MTKMTSAGLPAHEMTYRALKELLLFGEIAPGQAVTIQGLVARLEVGMTPVREALRRLISEGALEFQGNRRVSVPVLTPENLSELKFARAMIERELTLKAFSNIDENGLKQLESLDAGLDSAIARGDIGAYLRHNYEFHKTLYSFAGAPILESLADNLWLRYGHRFGLSVVGLERRTWSIIISRRLPLYVTVNLTRPQRPCPPT